MEENEENKAVETTQEAPEEKKEEVKEDVGGKSDVSKYLWIVGLVVVLGFGYYLVSRGRTEKATPSPSPVSNESLVPGAKNAVAVSDYTVGKTVTVAIVLLQKPGYVMIHEDDKGNPGKIIGIGKLLPVGESTNVVVTLTRTSKEAEVLYAMLHLDDGDGKFNATTDNPITDSQRNVVMMNFTVEAAE